MSNGPRTTVGFAGWLRLPGRPWQRVVEDHDEGECQMRLLRHADTVAGPHKDLTVMPAGEDPNRGSVRRARVRGNEVEFLIPREP